MPSVALQGAIEALKAYRRADRAYQADRTVENAYAIDRAFEAWRKLPHTLRKEAQASIGPWEC